VIHEPLKVWSASSPSKSLILQHGKAINFAVNFLKWGCLHTPFESPKLLVKETMLLFVLWNKDLIQVFGSPLWWKCKGLSMPTPDRVVVRPDSVSIVKGTTSCGGLGFPGCWSLFTQVIQFRIFLFFVLQNLEGSSIHTCNIKECHPSCNGLSLLHSTSLGLCSQWDTAIHVYALQVRALMVHTTFKKKWHWGIRLLKKYDIGCYPGIMESTRNKAEG
jgi:hypothetical protein